MTTLFSYIVRYDTGFAPNPFQGVCTLACCKPRIRLTAQKGDYVIGLAGSTYRKRVKAHWPIVYAMRVTEPTMTFEQYWRHPSFHLKRPNTKAGGEEALGDNIYHKDSRGHWVQEMSRHSNSDGPNPEYMKTDLNGRNVLASRDFIYWGSEGPPLPSSLTTLIVARNHKRFRSWVPREGMVVEEFKEWFDSFPEEMRGQQGMPFDWEEDADTPLCVPRRRSRKKC